MGKGLPSGFGHATGRGASSPAGPPPVLALHPLHHSNPMMPFRRGSEALREHDPLVCGLGAGCDCPVCAPPPPPPPPAPKCQPYGQVEIGRLVATLKHPTKGPPLARAIAEAMMADLVEIITTVIQEQSA